MKPRPENVIKWIFCPYKKDRLFFIKGDTTFLYRLMTAVDRQTGFHLNSGWARADSKIYRELFKKKQNWIEMEAV